jgi:hypothetical protein
MIEKTRHIALTLSVCLLVCTAATIAAAQTPPSLKPVPASKIDEPQKNKAAKIVTTTLNNWSEGKVAPLSNDVTPKMKERFAPDAQKRLLKRMKANAGDFQSLKFFGAFASPSKPGLVQYRFKGKFSKVSEPTEIRIVMNKQGKVVGASAKPSFKPVPASTIDQAQKDKAATIATTTLSNWWKGKFAPLSDDFGPKMKKMLTLDVQKRMTEKMKAKMGDLQALEFAEAVAAASPFMQQGIIEYRFKGKFSKVTEPIEIRVAMNKQGKVAGFGVRRWQDEMQ